MAARAVAKVSVSLGLFGFPVSIYKATDEPTSSVSFKILHEGCNKPINRKDSCSGCGATVTKTNSVKGFAEPDGSFLVFTEDEIKAMRPKNDGSLAITGYLPQVEMDPSYLSGDVYYLAPQDKSDPVTFATFRDALGPRFAIGSVVMYGREHIVAIRAFQSVLAMHFVRNHAEVRDIADLPGLAGIPNAAPAEYVSMMEQFMSATSMSFPEVALESDGYADAVMAAVEARRGGKPAPEAAPVAQQLAVNDLKAALMASLAAAGKAA